MPLQEKGEHTNHFNRQTNPFTKSLNNKIGQYELNAEERSKIQDLAAERKEQLAALQLELQDTLKANHAKKQLNHSPPNVRQGQAQLKNLRQAHDTYTNGVKSVEKAFDQKLDNILDRAGEDGRGPQDRQQNKSLSQDIDRQSDRDR